MLRNKWIKSFAQSGNVSTIQKAVQAHKQNYKKI